MTTIALLRALVFRLWPLIALILLLWLIWAMFLRKNDEREKPLPAWQVKMWYYTFIGSVAVLIITVVLTFTQMERDTESKYIPPRIEDGKIVPGQLIPEDEQP